MKEIPLEKLIEWYDMLTRLPSKSPKIKEMITKLESLIHSAIMGLQQPGNQQ